MLLINQPKTFLLTLLLLTPPVSATGKKELWKITSNSSIYNLAKKTITYTGNALFETKDLTIHGDEIRAVKVKQETGDLRVSGSLAKLVYFDQALSSRVELSASNIRYQLLGKLINANNNVLFVQKKENGLDDNTFFKVVGDQVNFSMVPSNLVKIKGSPLELVIDQTNQPTIIAHANEMSYDQQSNQFEISGNVNLFTGRENIKASKILYNSKTRTIRIPESQDQKVEMTQSEKQLNE